MASKEAEEYYENIEETDRILALRSILELTARTVPSAREVITNAFDAGVEFERQRHGWHNVKIELPKETRNYLVSYDENCKHSFYVIHYEADDWYGWYGEGSEEIILKPYWWKEIE